MLAMMGPEVQCGLDKSFSTQWKVARMNLVGGAGAAEAVEMEAQFIRDCREFLEQGGQRSQTLPVLCCSVEHRTSL
ncbi:hypothetical protein RK21_01104 [Pseudomonas plecoglossicida]|nr:hypothetical protein RK21_01104 [Pseudomonas plecoglossicida]